MSNFKLSKSSILVSLIFLSGLFFSLFLMNQPVVKNSNFVASFIDSNVRTFHKLVQADYEVVPDCVTNPEWCGINTTTDGVQDPLNDSTKSNTSGEGIQESNPNPTDADEILSPDCLECSDQVPTDSGYTAQTICSDLGKECGLWPNTTGRPVFCGNCTLPKICDDGQCALPSTPTSPTECIKQYTYICGGKNNEDVYLDDGCGGKILYQICTATSQTCKNGECTGECKPLTCDVDYAGRCGKFEDGCNSYIYCNCPSGVTCNKTKKVCEKCISNCFSDKLECGKEDKCGNECYRGICPADQTCSQIMIEDKEDGKFKNVHRCVCESTFKEPIKNADGEKICCKKGEIACGEVCCGKDKKCIEDKDLYGNGKGIFRCKEESIGICGTDGTCAAPKEGEDTKGKTSCSILDNYNGKKNQKCQHPACNGTKCEWKDGLERNEGEIDCNGGEKEAPVLKDTMCRHLSCSKDGQCVLTANEYRKTYDNSRPICRTSVKATSPSGNTYSRDCVHTVCSDNNKCIWELNSGKTKEFLPSTYIPAESDDPNCSDAATNSGDDCRLDPIKKHQACVDANKCGWVNDTNKKAPTCTADKDCERGFCAGMKCVTTNPPAGATPCYLKNTSPDSFLGADYLKNTDCAHKYCKGYKCVWGEGSSLKKGEVECSSNTDCSTTVCQGGACNIIPKAAGWDKLIQCDRKDYETSGWLGLGGVKIFYKACNYLYCNPKTKKCDYKVNNDGKNKLPNPEDYDCSTGKYGDPCALSTENPSDWSYLCSGEPGGSKSKCIPYRPELEEGQSFTNSSCSKDGKTGNQKKPVFSTSGYDTTCNKLVCKNKKCQYVANWEIKKSGPYPKCTKEGEECK